MREEESGAAEEDGGRVVEDVVDETAGFAPGTNSRPSTLAERRSFHSSPASPEYRSAIVASSHLHDIYN